MSDWSENFALLRCLQCGRELCCQAEGDSPGGLRCVSCGREYPQAGGAAVMFAEPGRAEILVNPELYAQHLASLENKAKQASGLTADQLGQFRQDEPEDSLGWEILFWERWKNDDAGFLNFDAERIEEFLASDCEGGGRAGFFEEIRKHCPDLSGKKLLNIGAGRDFLLERFTRAGCDVFEQDTVLEPLKLLKARGASFCVCSDARQLPFADNTFDLVTSFAVLHHIWPIEQTLAELLRVLKPGGLACFNEPNAWAITRAALVLPSLLKRKLKRFYSGDDTPSPYERSIGPLKFRRAIRANGGQIAEMSFKRTSWISPQSQGLKKFLRKVNIAAAHLLPITSSHFSALVRKQEPRINTDVHR